MLISVECLCRWAVTMRLLTRQEQVADQRRGSSRVWMIISTRKVGTRVPIRLGEINTTAATRSEQCRMMGLSVTFDLWSSVIACMVFSGLHNGMIPWEMKTIASDYGPRAFEGGAHSHDLQLLVHELEAGIQISNERI